MDSENFKLSNNNRLDNNKSIHKLYHINLHVLTNIKVKTDNSAIEKVGSYKYNKVIEFCPFL